MTVQELLQQYKTDPQLRAEVDDFRAKGDFSVTSVMAFARAHGVNIKLSDVFELISMARKAGLIN